MRAPPRFLLLCFCIMKARGRGAAELPLFASEAEEWAFHLRRGPSDHCSLRGMSGHTFIRKVYREAAEARNTTCMGGSVTLGGRVIKDTHRKSYIDGEKTLCADTSGGLLGLRPQSQTDSGVKRRCVVYALV